MKYALVATLLLLMTRNAMADAGTMTLKPSSGYIFVNHQVTPGTRSKRDVWWFENQLIPLAGYAAGQMANLDALTTVDASQILNAPFFRPKVNDVFVFVLADNNVASHYDPGYKFVAVQVQAVLFDGPITFRWKHVEAAINEKPCEFYTVNDAGGEGPRGPGTWAGPYCMTQQPCPVPAVIPDTSPFKYDEYRRCEVVSGELEVRAPNGPVKIPVVSSKRTGAVYYQDDVLIRGRKGTPQRSTRTFGAPWPKGEVYYTFDESILPKTRTRIAEAIKHWETVTTTRFQETKPSKSRPCGAVPACITFIEGDEWSSPLGRQGGQQLVNLVQPPLPKTCEVGQLVHVIGHAVGFDHDQLAKAGAEAKDDAQSE